MSADSALDSFGLAYGHYAPGKRALFAAVATTTVLFLAKPSFAFDDEGNPRPWAHFPPNVVGKSTQLPWWLVTLAAATVAGVFI